MPHGRSRAAKLGAPIDDGREAAGIGVSADVATALALFRTSDDDAETDSLLDRAACLRARWIASGSGGLPDAQQLVADAARVARLQAVPVSHAGHPH